MNRYEAYDSSGIALAGCLFLGGGIGMLVAIVQKLSFWDGTLIVGAGLVIGLGLGLLVMGTMVFRANKK